LWLGRRDGGVVIVDGEEDVQNVLFDVVGVDVKW
jgi:hypothetical protein